MRVEVALYERGLAHALGTEYHQFGVERSGLGGGRVSMGGCIDAGHEICEGLIAGDGSWFDAIETVSWCYSMPRAVQSRGSYIPK